MTARRSAEEGALDEIEKCEEFGQIDPQKSSNMSVSEKQTLEIIKVPTTAQRLSFWMSPPPF